MSTTCHVVIVSGVSTVAQDPFLYGVQGAAVVKSAYRTVQVYECSVCFFAVLRVIRACTFITRVREESEANRGFWAGWRIPTIQRRFWGWVVFALAHGAI
jgi:hypothetical protein